MLFSRETLTDTTYLTKLLLSLLRSIGDVSSTPDILVEIREMTALVLDCQPTSNGISKHRSKNSSVHFGKEDLCHCVL